MKLTPWSVASAFALALLASTAMAADKNVPAMSLGGQPLVKCQDNGDGTCSLLATTIVYRGEATARSLVITLGGTAQDLMAANATRSGFEVQNQSNDNCYIRSKGSAGATVATADQNSLLIYPGQWITPNHISFNAYSIICPTTGDLIYAREW